jgi:hypothetical protein
MVARTLAIPVNRDLKKKKKHTFHLREIPKNCAEASVRQVEKVEFFFPSNSVPVGNEVRILTF